MARRRVFWHIGPDDLGTAFLATALDAAREPLAEQGVLVAGTPTSWELATAELRRNHRVVGFRRAEVEGQNAQLVRRLWKHKGTSVLSTPGLASATPDQVLLALDGIRGAEIHLVLVVRDLTSQVWAGYQAALEAGATTRPEKFAHRVLEPREEHAQAAAYRVGHDVPDILRRWSRTVLPEHVHLIAATEPAEVWQRLTALLGAEVSLPDVPLPGQLGADQLALLRDVVLGLDDQLDPAARRTTLRDRLTRDLLPSAAGGPEPLDSPHLTATVEDWTGWVARKGFDLHGTFVAAATRPVGDVATSGPDAGATALAEVLVEVSRLRTENTALREENVRLDRKRRKHKRRLRALADESEGAA